MVRAWYFDNSDGAQEESHMTNPPQFVDISKIQEMTKVQYYKINADDFQNDKTLQELRKSRGYSYEDSVRITSKMENYEGRVKKFYKEHIHDDEEIRLVVEGSGYFDVRDDHDRWIRIETTKGDLLILPAGIYHRFTIDKNDYVLLNRYFVGDPVWTPFNRPADDHPKRIEYLQYVKA